MLSVVYRKEVVEFYVHEKLQDLTLLIRMLHLRNFIQAYITL